MSGCRSLKVSVIIHSFLSHFIFVHCIYFRVTYFYSAEIPVPLIRAFESENKQRLWKKLDGLHNVNPTEKLTFTHKCCSECAKFGVYPDFLINVSYIIIF